MPEPLVETEAYHNFKNWLEDRRMNDALVSPQDVLDRLKEVERGVYGMVCLCGKPASWSHTFDSKGCAVGPYPLCNECADVVQKYSSLVASV